MEFQNVAAILAEMTLDEKIAQLSAVSVVDLIEDGAFSLEKARARLAHGIGQITRIAGWSELPPEGVVELSHQVQAFLRQETRLGLPAIVHEECLAGLTARGTTVFPQPITLAASWNPALLERVGDAIRKEIRALGSHQGLGPVLDIIRDPRWGRCEETYGEDQHLVACMALATIRGLQGNDLRVGVGATAKHFVGHGCSEGGRNEAPTHIGPRQLRDVFLHPYERVVKEADLFAIMNAYHDNDAVPCAGSRELLTGILRDEWGFKGIVVSDYEAVDQLRRMHFTADGKEGAAAQAINAGIDVELPEIDCFGAPLHAAVAAGLVSEATIDRTVTRILEAKERLGLFDRVPARGDLSLLNCDTHRALAVDAARAAIVLLKNDGALPLQRNLKSLAVIGPNADAVRNMIGDYTYEAAFGLADDTVPSVTVLAGIRNILGENARIDHVMGCDIGSHDRSGFATAVAAAQAADAVVLVMGGRSGSQPVLRGYAEHGDTSGEGRDRAEIGLPGVQEELVRAVSATGKPVVLVVIDGRPLALGAVADHVAAILYAWLPSKEGGIAVADALFGNDNPGGRLPVSLARDVGQVPVHYARHPASFKWHYIFGPNTPLFPFGHGLSYTRFAYRNLVLQAERLREADSLSLTFDLANEGDIAGDEVVQLYVRDVLASVVRPVKELKAFQRLRLEPGEMQQVRLDVPVRSLAFHDASLNRVVEPGEFELQIGASSEDIRLRAQFEVIG